MKNYASCICKTDTLNNFELKPPLFLNFLSNFTSTLFSASKNLPYFFQNYKASKTVVRVNNDMQNQ